MTDWGRVKRERGRGASWDEIAADPKTGFSAPAGSNPGRALKTLYLQRKGRGDLPRGSGNGEEKREAKGLGLGRSRLFQVAVVVVALGLVVGGLVYYFAAVRSNFQVPYVVSYCGGADQGVTNHYHALLVIDVNGQQVPLPYDPNQSADIGFINAPGYTNSTLYCPNSEIHAIHSHDGSGILHMELPAGVTSVPTLGDFFMIWGEPLSPTHAWGYAGTVSTQVVEMDAGSHTSYNANPGAVPLRPAQGNNSNPFPIPQSLIFNGQYG
ncbi:MAG TPA: hypothetical protein VJS68_00185, partial [Thermoplasmata archaeon]|nr:hypothetical protein [Thermoplasmata archaeon]